MSSSNSQPTAEQIWKPILQEMEIQMPAVFYNMTLANAQPKGWDIENNVLTLAFDNPYQMERSKTILENQTEMIGSMIYGRPVKIKCYHEPKQAPEPELQAAQKAPPSGSGGSTAGPAVPSDFLGWHDFQSNWTKVPDIFFTHVIRNERPAVASFIAAIIFGTVGRQINKRGDTAEWWETSKQEAMKASGINSKTAFLKALWDARTKGYIVCQFDDNNRDFKTRLRWWDEPIDHPYEDRPGY